MKGIITCLVYKTLQGSLLYNVYLEKGSNDRISCLWHYNIHYLSIPLYTKSWFYIIRTLFRSTHCICIVQKSLNKYTAGLDGFMKKTELVKTSKDKNLHDNRIE